MKRNRNCRIITSKEAQQVLKRSIRHARRILDDVRAHFKKLPWQPVTVKEFCDYLNFNIDDVFDILGWE